MPRGPKKDAMGRRRPPKKVLQARIKEANSESTKKQHRRREKGWMPNPNLAEEARKVRERRKALGLPPPAKLTANKAAVLKRLRNGANRLRKDDPLRTEDGLTLNPVRALRILYESLSPSEKSNNTAILRRIEEIEEQINGTE